MISASVEVWSESQAFELDYWKNHWPFRNDGLAALQKSRHEVGEWFLGVMGFEQAVDGTFPDFKGDVLEVGCGPIGFFELFSSIKVDAIDSLMSGYAQNIDYAVLGTRGSVTYSAQSLFDVSDTYDHVVCSNVLDHTADWIEFLEGLVRRVKPGGNLLLYTDTRGIPATGHTQVFFPDQVVRCLAWLGAKEFKVNARSPGDDHCDARCIVRCTF
jgi:2-polyprenyl-3-methyl-5-hydroxy-6-metoxy-1,4-benzoquinol methylase